jgi:hypothetical protein
MKSIYKIELLNWEIGYRQELMEEKESSQVMLGAREDIMIGYRLNPMVYQHHWRPVLSQMRHFKRFLQKKSQ